MSGFLLELRHVRGGLDWLPKAWGARDHPAGPVGPPPRAVRLVRPAGVVDMVPDGMDGLNNLGVNNAD